MSNLTLASTNGTALVQPGGDPFASYGAKVGQQGTFLNFNKGEWLYGQDKKEMPLGTRLVANMEGLRIGWVRWFDKKMTDDLAELLTDMRPLQSRNTLGDNDPTMWELDDRGDPRDPWTLSNILQMVSDDGEEYIYTTSSKGGIGAIGRLCKAYGQQRRQHPGQVPVLELGRDFYDHPKWGKTYFPVLTIVGWMDEGEAMVAAAAEDTIPFPTEPPPIDLAAGQRAANPTQAAPSTTTSPSKRTKF
jgi:hypothetical protein